MRGVKFLSVLFVLFIAILFAGTVLAASAPAYNETKTYSWLQKQLKGKNLDISTLSTAYLALSSNSNNQELLTKNDLAYLQAKADSKKGCFPKNSCNSLDTAMGMLALNSLSQDITSYKEYLLNGSALAPGLKDGDWRLQLDVAGDGECSIAYADGKSKSFKVNNSVINGASGKYYLAFNGNELRSDIVNQQVSQPINIDCKDISGTGMAGTVSLVFYSQGSYFLLDSSPLSNGLTTLKIINGCFRSASGGACSLDSSLFATWALAETGVSLGDIGTIPYLETMLIKGSTDLQKAILVRILEVGGSSNKYFSDSLVLPQKNGQWANGDIYTTSWATFALEKTGSYGSNIDASTKYLMDMNTKDNWGGSVKNTAMALLALNGGAIRQISFQEETNVTECSTAEDCNETGYTCSDAGECVPANINASCTDNYACDEGTYCDTTSGTCKVVASECTKSEDCGMDYICDETSKTCKPITKKATVDEICSGTATDDFGRTGCASEECTDREECKNTEEPAPEPYVQPEPTPEPEEPTPEPDPNNPNNPNPPEPESSSFIWILIVILVIAAAGGGVIYLKSTGKLDSILGKKPKGPSFEQFKMQFGSKPSSFPAKPAGPIGGAKPASSLGFGKPSGPSKTFSPVVNTGSKLPPLKKPGAEDELEKSLREAEKLLKGK